MKRHSNTVGQSSIAKANREEGQKDATLRQGNPVIYEYRDETGQLQSQVVITPILDENGVQVKKKTRQRRPVGRGFAYTLKGGYFVRSGPKIFKRVCGPDDPRPTRDAVLLEEPARRVLYRLSEVIDAVNRGQTILIVEGERDVETLRNVGFVATTNPGGAGRWKDEYSETLKGAAFVVIIPDCDDAGREHAEKVGAQLHGEVDDLRILRLPDLDEGEDVSDWVAHGGDVDQFIVLLAEAPPFEEADEGVYEIVDNPPAEMSRPLALISGTGYLATKLFVARGEENQTTTVVASSDGDVFSSVPLPGSKRLDDLPFTPNLPTDLQPTKLLGPSGLRQIQENEQVSAGAVFHKIVNSALAFFDFSRSLAAEASVARLVALIVIQTFFLAAFSRIGYVFFSGPPGSGKSKLLAFIMRLAYLGEFLGASSTYASVRDIAEAGATIGIDDYDPVLGSDSDRNLRSLYLTGITKDTNISLMVRNSRGGWEKKRVGVHGFRMFTSTSAPDEVFASRMIMVPLIPSSDNDTTARDPESDHLWPHDPRRLLDDLWILGVRNLPRVRKIYEDTKSDVLKGRAFDSWRPILTVARWLEEDEANDLSGLYDEMHEIAVDYQESRRDLEQDHVRQILLRALWKICWRLGARGTGSVRQPSMNLLDRSCEVSPKRLVDVMTEIAREEGLIESGFSGSFITTKKAGVILSQYRFPQGQRKKTGRCRVVKPKQVLELADALGITLPDDPRESHLTPGVKDVPVDTPTSVDADDVPECHECRSPGSERAKNLKRIPGFVRRFRGFENQRSTGKVRRRPTYIQNNDTHDTHDTSSVPHSHLYERQHDTDDTPTPPPTQPLKPTVEDLVNGCVDRAESMREGFRRANSETEEE